MEWLQNYALAMGYISEEDFKLVRVCDHVGDVVEAVQRWYIKQELVGRKALLR